MTDFDPYRIGSTGYRPARPPPSRWTAMDWAWVVAVLAIAVMAVGGGAVGGWAYTEHMTQPAANEAPPPNTFAGSQLDVTTVLDLVEPSVVSVAVTYVVEAGGYGELQDAAGTGVIMTADGEVLTSAHVVNGATTIEVVLTGSVIRYAADIVAIDNVADIAVIKMRGAENLTPAPLGDSDELRVGDEVVAIGNALALSGGPTVTKGIVSGLDRAVDTDTTSLTGMIQTDAAISSGNSGGPLVNAAGQVVGINTAVATSSDTIEAHDIGFAIPMATVLRELDEFEKG